MLIENTFRVDLPFDRTWQVMTDLERIAPCMPGAQLTGTDGDTHQGLVKVKVGSITTEYRGSAKFVEADPLTGRIVLEATGHETRGQGRASATVTATLGGDDTGTNVAVATDLQISGRVAQFGRGVLQDVSTKLLEQFIDRLQSEFGDTPAQNGPVAGGGSSDPDERTGGEPNLSIAGIPTKDTTEPLDLVELSRDAVLRRAAPIVATIVAVVVAFVLGRRSASS